MAILKIYVSNIFWNYVQHHSSIGFDPFYQLLPYADYIQLASPVSFFFRCYCISNQTHLYHYLLFLSKESKHPFRCQYVNISTDNDTIRTSHFEIITMTNADIINMRKSSGRSPDSYDKICSSRKQIPRKLQRNKVIISINNVIFIQILT